MQTIYLDVNTTADRAMCELARRAFPGYTGRQFKITISDSPINCASYWSGGSRDYFAFLNLATGEASAQMPAQSAFDRRVEGLDAVPLPPGFACVRHTIFCGKDMGLTLIVRSDNAAAMLPAPVTLPRVQSLVLAYTRSRKPSYNGRDRYGMMIDDLRAGWKGASTINGKDTPAPTRAEWDQAIAELIAAGYLTRGKAITPKGRNAAASLSV